MNADKQVTLPTREAPVEYQLYAVAEHDGPSAASGHYRAYVRIDFGQWWCADDENIIFEYRTYIAECIIKLHFERIN